MPDFKIVKNEENKPDRTPERAILRHRVWKVLGVAATAAAFIAVIVLLNRDYQNKTYDDYEILAKSVRQDSDTSEYLAYNGHVLKYSRDGAEAFDGTDKVLWNVTYEMQKPKISTCGDYVAIGDEQGTEILVTDSAERLQRIETKLPVLNFCVNKNGMVAAVLEDSGTSWIRLYDRDGSEIASIRCSMMESGYPADVSLSESGVLLAVSYVRVEGEDLKSSVAFYNFGEVGANQSDHYMSGYDFDGTLIPRVKFMNDSAAFAMGDNKMAIFIGDQKPEKRFEYGFDTEVEGIYYGEERIVLVRRNIGDEGYTADVYNLSGDVILSQKFTLEYSDIQITRDRLIVYNESRCLIYNMKGKIKFDGAFDDATLLCAPTADARKYVLINRETAQQIRLR